MNDIHHNVLEKDINELFGFGALSVEEKASLLDDVGAVILESSALRFMAESDEERIKQFEGVIDAHAENDDMLAAVLKEFPRFGEILEEEVVAFKEEAFAVLS